MSTKRFSRRRLLIAGAVVAFGFLLLLAWDVYRVRTELSDGQQALDDLTLEAAGAQGISAYADSAAAHLRRADRIARTSVPLKVLSVLPVAGDQIDGVRDLTGVISQLGDDGAEAARAIDAKLKGANEPAGRVALLDEAIAQLDRLDADLDDLDLGSGDQLAGPVGKAHDDLVQTIDHAREKLADGRELITPVRAMLAGPSTYLLLAANNAEMAAGTGLTLSAGPVDFVDGDIRLGEVVAARDVRLADSVDVPPNLKRIYRPTGVGIDFRSTTRSPNLPAMGPLTETMVTALGEHLGRPDLEVDGLVIVDAVALRDVLALTGPVKVNGKVITAKNVLAETLNENYKAFKTPADTPERVSYQGDIAKAIFDSLTTRDIPAAKLAKALLDSSKGRHLQLWSKDPAVQKVWHKLQVDGSLPKGGLMVAFQNYSANKLDWYLRPKTAINVDLTPDGDYRVHLVMTVKVPTAKALQADDASEYILGPTPLRQGMFLTAFLPEAAYDITTPTKEGFETKGEDGPLQARTFLDDVALGSTYRRQVDFTLPREQFGMLLLPSGRVAPMPVTIDDVVTVTDATPRFITWVAAVPPPPPSDAAPLPVLILVRLGLVLIVAAAVALATVTWRTRRRPLEDGDRSLLRLATALAVTALIAFAVSGLLGLMAAAPRV